MMGVFSWNLKTLHQNIKAVKKDYITTDPRTWPLIIDLNRDSVKDRHNIPALPWGVAYEKHLMVDHQVTKGLQAFYDDLPVLKCTPSISKRLSCFYYYPYNFTSRGRRRDRTGMSQLDLEFWTRGVNGIELPTTMEETVTEERTEESTEESMDMNMEQSTDLSVESSTEMGAEPSTELSTEIISRSTEHNAELSSCVAPTTYDRIMNVLRRHKETALENFAAQEEMENLKEELQQETERADAAELAVKDLEDALETETVDAQNHIICLETKFQQEIAVAHGQVKAVKARLEDKHNELVVAQEEVKAANKQMEDIWKMLSEMQGDAST